MLRFGMIGPHIPTGRLLKDRMRMNVERFLAAALVVATAGVCADIEKLEGIVAIVDDDVVLASELAERYNTVYQRIMQSDAEAKPSPDAIMSQLMERLIIERIQLQMANQRGIDVDDETLTQRVSAFAAENQMTLDQFREALEKEGMSYRMFREDIRRELQLQRLQQAMIRRRVSISDQDVDDLIDSPAFRELTSDEYRVGHILLAVESGASEETIARAAAAADDIIARLRDGADFAQMAVEHSAASTALEGGDLGWRRAAELPSLFGEAVLRLVPGETADPIRNSLGFHIIQLLERRGVSQQRQVQSLVRHILVQPSAIQSPEQTRELAHSLFDRIVDGEDFAELAREHSEDAGSAMAGGELGWSDGSEYVPEFRAAIANLDVGELGKPFQSEFGWHIAQVVDRRDQDVSDDARRNLAVQVLYERRFGEELQEWLQEIRDEAFVELRTGG